jgi:serine/threonine protein phosphatase PrpC
VDDINEAPTMLPGEQKVSPIPDIIMQPRDPSKDEFILVACDGIWDVQTNPEACKTVADIFAEGENNIGLVCEEVCVCIGLYHCCKVCSF